ncbi:hypothetical protein BDV59DRAFT_187042 [Aspergillus ambiguus]|uniref:DUF2841 domain-containing protein n=1 Tax=Aspergillus ambiguus TaxID=176160 RepID=UPI003CCDF5A3
MNTPVKLPFFHYALIYIDIDGKLRVSESPSICAHDTLFTTYIRKKFLAMLKPRNGYAKSALPGPSRVRSTHGCEYSEDPCGQVRKREVSVQDPTVNIHASGRSSNSVEENSQSSKVSLEIGDKRRVLAYYTSAFEHLLQANCCCIAKAFIRFIEPRKQKDYPYNGHRARRGAAKGKGDPEKTKPQWWPTGVIHKEPDHLGKDARIRLLVHIVRELKISSNTLREIAHESRRWRSSMNLVELTVPHRYMLRTGTTATRERETTSLSLGPRNLLKLKEQKNAKRMP